MFAKFINDFTLGDGQFAGLEVGAGAGSVLAGFLGEAGERVIKPQYGQRGRGCKLGVFHRVFHRRGLAFGGGFLEELAEENRGVAAVATELDEVAFRGESLLGEAEEGGGFFPGDLVVHG